MSALQQILDRRRADGQPEGHLCHSVEPQLAALTVITSAQERWIFPWHQLASAQFTAGVRDQLRLTFTSHLVTITGRDLLAFCDLVARTQLASIRPAPTKYAKATPNDPFVESLHVAPHPPASEQASAANPSD